MTGTLVSVVLICRGPTLTKTRLTAIAFLSEDTESFIVFAE